MEKGSNNTAAKSEDILYHGPPNGIEQRPIHLIRPCCVSGKVDHDGQHGKRKRMRNVTFISTFLLALGVIHYTSRFSVVNLGQQTYRWLHPYRNALDELSDVVACPADLSNNSGVMGETPQYVLDYAPLVHLFSEEQFWPCDIAEHLHHVTPDLDYTPIQDAAQVLNLSSLDQLNDYDKGRHVYLTSNDNVEERPDWLGGQKNIPDEFGEDGANTQTSSVRRHPRPRNTAEQTHGGRSDAPAVLITVDKGHGIVDAFWFYFYSYNLGNVVFNVRFGNHVGDWEHSLVRFHHGKPKLVFFSEHNFGAAYTYKAVEKIGKRVSSSSYPSISTHH